MSSELHLARQIPLPAAERAPGLARQATRDAVTAWRVTDVEETAVLLVSELVTNAVRHARAGTPAVALRLELAGAFLRIEVHDADARVPQPRTPGALDGSGFGLLLIAAMSDKWGVRQTKTGKAVWVEIDISANHPR